MTELNAIEKKDGRHLSLQEFLNLEYEEINIDTVKEDLAYIINNFHNLTRELKIEPVSNLENFVVEYESATIKNGATRTTTVRTPAPQEQDLNKTNVNPHNTYAGVEYRELKETVQPIFNPLEAGIYLDMTQRVLRESPEFEQNNG